MNIGNLNKLIAHLEFQPSEKFNMRWIFSHPEFRDPFIVADMHSCGTAACIAGHCIVLMGVPVGESITARDAQHWLGITRKINRELFMPYGWDYDPAAFTLSRAIATLKRLRDTYLSTGQVVVDWGPEPGEEPKQVWTAPQVAEVINPVLPIELTRLLHDTVEA